ncbi:ArsR/SmtB family transcription factor [Bacillus paranthracis]|uniref:ArsR/SmtB family transcription factor n=1 Tax=Bacillus cereus group TaxID=86661 RepID=UPI0023626B63|nr:metalloregulator ArsR/SmtB family transcription factor [Bacillus cereus]MDD0820660.1 metalloregulator ArsR/SmtB family transcription factor [Bacillus cereus]
MSIYKENAHLLKAISHSIRIQIVIELNKKGPCTVNQIAEFLGRPQSTTSQHLAIMKSQKILASNRKGYEVYYSVQNKKINTLIEVLLEQKIDKL